MIDNNKINTRQFTCLVILFVIGDTLLFVPSDVTSIAKQDGWLSALLAAVMGIFLVTLYGFLGKRFPSMNIVDISEKVLSLWFGKIIGVLFVFFALIDSSITVWELGDFMTTKIMPDTPINAILILFLSIIIFGIHVGVESLARTAEIIFPWVILLFLILVLSVSPKINLENIQPVLEDGVKPVLRGSLPLIGFYFESVLLLMVLPYVNQTKRITKSFVIGMITGSSALFIIILLSILVLGSHLTSNSIYPSYALARKINIGNFVQRIEAILAFIWFFTVYFKVTICFYATTAGLAQIFKIKDHKVLMVPLALIVYALALITAPSTTYVNQFLLSIWWTFTLSYGLFLPLLLITVAKLRNKY
ncbi:spore gernimation protein [Domibacillus aminovorans]|uniref:Spore gernimation protein n=1 Tax=Domibacillus aminovorans TaxID=29332 RepID=A0A177KYC4_9BACI|nr:endospore germination permease [Domibacillus aminovorans]OAH58343.1 spore gernimation protein [Domibacillus aminovorans]